VRDQSVRDQTEIFPEKKIEAALVRIAEALEEISETHSAMFAWFQEMTFTLHSHSDYDDPKRGLRVSDIGD
jgi:hypothetical protein